MQRLTCVLISAFIFINASAQKDSLEATIEGFFDGLSQLSESKLKEYTTADFLLLENGAVWNIDTLVSKISPLKNVSFKRVNSFSFISSKQKGDVAWISYHNTAHYTVNERQQTRNWLESAVLMRQAGRWKIQLLHSTKKG
jgi:Domain of unknown function (DUF4440)